MNTKLLMVTSAGFLGILGVGISFFPDGLLTYSGGNATPLSVVIVQITGALCLGFAMVNWTARGNLIGGIYSRPVAIGNFLHFAVVTIALLKVVMAGQREPLILTGTVLYLVFSVAFGFVLFTSPARRLAKNKPD